MIPEKYTCDGEDVSPPLRWEGIPPGARSLALICDDPDAPMATWVHWVIYSIPPNTTGLREALSKTELVEGRMKQGKNSWRMIGYGGPCPPGGRPHRYFFKLYALDTELALGPGADKKELESAMKGHIIGQAEVMGIYARS